MGDAVNPHVEVIAGVRYLVVGTDRYALSDGDCERLLKELRRHVK